jgi:hypothetical protein
MVDDASNFVDSVIWRVPTARKSQSGLRCRLAFVRRDEGKRVVLREPFVFTGVDQLVADFMADVRRITGDERWPRR